MRTARSIIGALLIILLGYAPAHQAAAIQPEPTLEVFLSIDQPLPCYEPLTQFTVSAAVYNSGAEAEVVELLWTTRNVDLTNPPEQPTIQPGRILEFTAVATLPSGEVLIDDPVVTIMLTSSSTTGQVAESDVINVPICLNSLPYTPTPEAPTQTPPPEFTPTPITVTQTPVTATQVPGTPVINSPTPVETLAPKETPGTTDVGVVINLPTEVPVGEGSELCLINQIYTYCQELPADSDPGTPGATPPGSPGPTIESPDSIDGDGLDAIDVQDPDLIDSGDADVVDGDQNDIVDGVDTTDAIDSTDQTGGTPIGLSEGLPNDTGAVLVYPQTETLRFAAQAGLRSFAVTFPDVAPGTYAIELRLADRGPDTIGSIGVSGDSATLSTTITLDENLQPIGVIPPADDAVDVDDLSDGDDGPLDLTDDTNSADSDKDNDGGNPDRADNTDSPGVPSDDDAPGGDGDSGSQPGGSDGIGSAPPTNGISVNQLPATGTGQNAVGTWMLFSALAAVLTALAFAAWNRRRT